MADMLNGKTPDEIKKGLFCGSGNPVPCEECAYRRTRECNNEADADALDYIQQLESGIDHAEKVAKECAKSITENMKKLESRLAKAEPCCAACAYNSTGDGSCIAHIHLLEERLAQAERERDAAVNDLKESSFCCDCLHYAVPAEKEPCLSCFKRMQEKPKWKWRGVCAENTKEDDHG